MNDTRMRLSCKQSGGELAAVQTLREVKDRQAIAPASGVRCLQHRFRPGELRFDKSALGLSAFAAAALAAVLVALIPGANDWLVFDRVRIEAGEFWRLVTGHWVHFSTSHLVWNLVALGAAGMLASGIKSRAWAVLMTSALAIGAAVFLLEPELRWFGGLSGVATAMIAWAVAGRAKSQPAFRTLALAGILLLIAKLSWEAATTHSVFASFATEGVRTSWIAHLVGLLVGAAFGLAPNQLRFRAPDSGLITRSSEIADTRGYDGRFASLECGDLSPLFRLATRRQPGAIYHRALKSADR